VVKAIVAVVTIAAAFALASVSMAQTSPAPVPAPKFKASARAQNLDEGPATYISARADGCYDETEASIDPASPWSIDDYSCVTIRLHLARNGKPAAVDQDEFHDPDSETAGAAGMLVFWGCARTGTYRWTVRYTNASVPGFSTAAPYTAQKTGTFRVRRCVRPLGRYVDRGTAAARAHAINEDYYEGEFISAVHCAPGSPVRGARSTVWTCQTTHNNTYRECTDRDRLRFTRRDEWGRAVKDYDVSSQGKRCRFF
jgi:hypothetical protein